MAQRKNYWSCSKFADWLRGTTKIEAGTSKQWREWKEQAHKTHPVRYWIAEEGLDMIQNFIWWPIDRIYDVKYYINNRYITHTHCLRGHKSDLVPGRWYDLSNRILPCLFNELRDFVEVELAWFHLVWESKEERAKYNMPWWAAGWWRIRTWRCPQAGLDNLAWQINLKADDSWGLKEGDEGYGEPTLQAKNAKEILELYKWWIEVYPNRPDPYEVSGWHDICNRRRENGKDFFDFEDRTEQEEAETRNSLDMMHKIEQQYRDEDTEMMIRLIRVRDSLWT
jgi:hypothetical protein